jgi:hypothetical protein
MPLWWTGVDGTDVAAVELLDAGVWGDKRNPSSVPESRFEGVCGNRSRPSFVGDCARGRTGNGKANSFCGFLVGDLDGDDGAMGNFCEAAPLLGDAEARVRVKAEGLVAAGSGGRSVKGMGGTDSDLAWNLHKCR